MKPAASLLLALTLLGALPAAAQEKTRRAGGIDEERLVELIAEAVRANEQRKWGRELPPELRNDRDKLAYQRLRRSLDGARVSVAFDGTSFVDCLDFLRDVTGLNIVASKEALEAYKDAEVKLKLKKVTLKSVLELLAEQLGKDLRYGLRNGVLWIGLQPEVKQEMVLRFYEVSDIIANIPDFPGPKMGLKGLTWDRD
ncbi:MAG: hypothetical protein AB7N76_03720 [Planctomycetota bacterium]